MKPKANSPRSIELIKSSIKKLIKDKNYQWHESVALCKKGLTTSTWCDPTPAEEKEKRINATTSLEHLETVSEQSGKETDAGMLTAESSKEEHNT